LLVSGTGEDAPQEDIRDVGLRVTPGYLALALMVVTLEGILTLTLVPVFLTCDGFPDIATWALGVLAGINLLCTGLSLIMLTIAERQQPGMSYVDASSGKTAQPAENT
jgi:hypothetical protein